jgi:hypothetical protein
MTNSLVPHGLCILVLAIGLAVIFFANPIVGEFSRWLRKNSRLEPREVYEEGVPVWITGYFERLLAFLLVVLHVEGAYTLIALWLGAKLAASWQRIPTDIHKGDDWKRREHSRQVRAGTLCALIAGIVSILIGVGAGLVVRVVCQCCTLP